MTYGAFSPGDFAAYEGKARSENSLSLPLLCGVTLVASASVGLWMLYAPGPTTPDVAASPPSAPPSIEATLDPVSTTVAPPAAIAPLRRYASFLDPSFAGGSVPGTFAQSAPLRSGFGPLRRRSGDPLAAAPIELRTADADPSAPNADDTKTDTKVAALEIAPSEDTEPSVVPPAPTVSEIQNDIPLPTPRPRFEEPEQGAVPVAPTPRRIARAPVPGAAPAAPAAPGSRPSFFDKIFGQSQTPPSAAVLAYATPETSGIGSWFGGSRPSAAPDRYTAVYDISAHTVYLPDGTQLEAHSGLGDGLDNPASVAQRMRGATPPNVYELTQRESLFHGVRALRLTPTGGTTYGRGGLLAHTYMLRGRSGESNGCVVFRNYEAFLRAFDNGQIRRLAVVARRA